MLSRPNGVLLFLRYICGFGLTVFLPVCSSGKVDRTRNLVPQTWGLKLNLSGLRHCQQVDNALLTVQLSILFQSEQNVGRTPMIRDK